MVPWMWMRAESHSLSFTHSLNARIHTQSRCPQVSVFSREKEREGERERAGPRGRGAMLNLKLCFLLYYNSSRIPNDTDGAYSLAYTTLEPTRGLTNSDTRECRKR